MIVDEQTILKKIYSRYKNCLDRSLKLGIKPPILDDYLEIFYESYSKDFCCPYCKNKMEIIGSDQRHIFSFDHIIPLSNKGTNDKANLKLCCYMCNIVKGTVSLDLWNTILTTFSNEERIRYLNEAYYGALGSKIDRARLEEKTQ